MIEPFQVRRGQSHHWAWRLVVPDAYEEDR